MEEKENLKNKIRRYELGKKDTKNNNTKELLKIINECNFVLVFSFLLLTVYTTYKGKYRNLSWKVKKKKDFYVKMKKDLKKINFLLRKWCKRFLRKVTHFKTTVKKTTGERKCCIKRK